jgi:hypothetical protein
MRFLFCTAALLPLVAFCCAAGAKPIPTPSQTQSASMCNAVPFGAASLIERLRGLGADVLIEGTEVDQPFFSITGQMIRVRGEDVQVFEFSGAEAADKEAAPISPDGMTVGTSKIHWIGNPHFFKKGKLIVLYVGDNPRVLADLTHAIGPQFAGKDSRTKD